MLTDAGMQAASGEDFLVSQRVGMLVSFSTLVALAAFLAVHLYAAN
jgi:hypothetical protein